MVSAGGCCATSRPPPASSAGLSKARSFVPFSTCRREPLPHKKGRPTNTRSGTRAGSIRADHPQIVADLFLVDGADGRVRLRRWNSATHVFELSLWPESLGNWRPQFEQAYAAARAQLEPDLRGFTGEESLILQPLRSNFGIPRPGSRVEPPPAPVFGFTVIQLDMAYIRGEMLRALAEQHFTNPSGDSYRVAVTAGDDAKRILYRSDPSASIDARNADVIEPLGRAGFLRGPARGRAARSANGGLSNADVSARWRLYRPASGRIA